ncbi:sensor histidine kinase [Halodesulfurarchaeum sp.]|uniref:sensor histidine kinase n=1 Tax=Halodesulfurarchaeum sp. TaxID=1980530 RepID=UPI002FC36482
MGAEDPTIPSGTRLASDFDPEDVPTLAWGTLMAGLGFLLAAVHFSHIGEARALWASVVGVLLPFAISVGGIMSFGVLLVLPREQFGQHQVDFIRRTGPWVAGWMFFGMLWMSIAGAGSVIYQSSQGLFEPGSVFLIAIFASYGAIPGVITGYYYGRTAQAATEIAERERYLAVFSRVLRHNFRNQMNLLLGELDLAEQEAPPDASTHVDRAGAYGRDLMETVEKQRFLVETVTEPKSPRNQRGSAVIRKAVDSVREMYPESAVSVDTNGDTVVSAHPQIDRALMELLENAIVHSTDSASAVTLESRRANDSIVVSVSNAGPPIPASEKAILTRDHEPNQLHHGSGLGLWIVDRLTEQSHGSVEIQRSETVRNTVSLELPIPHR